MITYQTENYFDCVEELSEIYPQHYQELTVSRNFPLMPDYERYANLAKSGILKLLTVRNDAELIGYTIMLVSTALHYKTCVVAHEDLYFVKPEYRKGRVGIKMFKFVEDEMKKIGVDRIVMGTKVYADNSKLFEYLGYRFYEKLYTKEI
jgi:GNAT superfamily N-acetyltransferase